jgi:hypothetical protein
MFENSRFEAQFRQSKFLNEAKQEELIKEALRSQKKLSFRQKLGQALIQLGNSLNKDSVVSRA